jgi:hypothetical protein
MRSWFFLMLAACATNTAAPVQQQVAFQIQSSDLTLDPGDEMTKCFYFHTPNTAAVHLDRWVSDMTPGSHHMIMFTNLGTQPADGTVDDCSFANALPIPIYLTQTAHQEVVFPSDDHGVQLAQVVQPNTPGFFQMHYLNTTDSPLTVNVAVSAYALDVTKPFTRTEIFATYNNDIAIPPHATGFNVSASCPSDPAQMAEVAGAKFWSMSTHSHKQTVQAQISDANTVALTTDDWQHPAQAEWDAPSFFSFASGQISWTCTYDNTGTNANNTIVSGQSAQTNEMCMAVGYYFPVIGAFGPNGCFMSGGSCRCPEL